MLTFAKLRAADQRAVRTSLALAAAADPADLSRPTPCGTWTLGELLAHMTVQHLGFADAASGSRTELPRWQPVPLGDDAVAAYRASCERVVAAFAEPGVEERPFWLPEIRDGGPFPAKLAVGFHLIDYVVHAWDVAASLGRDVGHDPDVLSVAVGLAETVPDGPERTEPNAAFAPSLPVADAASLLDRILLLLGRSPRWPD